MVGGFQESAYFFRLRSNNGTQLVFIALSLLFYNKKYFKIVIFIIIWPFLFRLGILVISAFLYVPSLAIEISCQNEFLHLLIGFLVTWFLSILVEIGLIIVSWKGTILEDELRWHSEYLLYIKLGKVVRVNNEFSDLNYPLLFSCVD